MYNVFFLGHVETRSGLPIAELKSEILQVLKEKSVLVVCGETGSGRQLRLFFLTVRSTIYIG
ncbi:hypothetical protein CK203_050577 [Vitis vinifera]|uniref:Uncharacterized protein n=1 Tax=Vitis vinifera TaxID=29760 RepID=A0A438GFJ0_VITVI|nr:hypothetical protein CK203_050577 [Vitis vinifera]